jgi:hypothetical protein
LRWLFHRIAGDMEHEPVRKVQEFCHVHPQGAPLDCTTIMLTLL